MTQTAYTARNGDGSLKHRVAQCVETLEAYDNIKSINQHLADPDLADVIGEAEDIAQAEVILKNSMSRIADLVDQDEIKQALADGLVSEAQAWEISNAREQALAQQNSDKKKRSQSRSR